MRFLYKKKLWLIVELHRHLLVVNGHCRVKHGVSSPCFIFRIDFSEKLNPDLNKSVKSQESLGRPNSLTVPASLLLSYFPSLSSQAYANSGRLGCHATVKVGESH